MRVLLLALLITPLPLAATAGEIQNASARFGGFYLQYSPQGVRFFSTVEIENRGRKTRSFMGYLKDGKLFLDANQEARQENTSKDGTWEPVSTSPEDRRAPTEMMSIKPGEKNVIYIHWDEINFIRKADRRFRYVLSDIDGHKLTTDPFRPTDKSDSLTMGEIQQPCR
jgi:hypothetical protein